MTLLPVTDAGGLTYLHRHTAALGKGRHHRELQSVFVFAFFSLAAPKHLNEAAGMARARDYWVTLAGILLFSVASWATDCWGH